MLSKLKSYMMPISMLIGVIFYDLLNHLSFLTPALIFIMLFISYCNLSFSDLKLKKLHIWLILIQLFGSIAVYLVLYPLHPVIAQGVMICILAPTATSAIVITGMLGGNMVSLASFSLLSNLVVAICAPLLFSVIGQESGIPFWESVLIISEKVFVVLLLPFVLAILLKRFAPNLHESFKKHQSISFYLWNFALMIVTAKTIVFILAQGSSSFRLEVVIALLALVACSMQFMIGKKLGTIYDDRIAGGQSLGQKNTILAIWMTQTYLMPLSSIGPGAYILWQNIINSYQVWKKKNSHRVTENNI